MKVERNVEGLRQNAQKKRQQALAKVETGIQRLIKEKRVINFNTVAEASGVSKAWLYKEPEVRVRVEQLRSQTEKKNKLPPRQRASDASKEALIQTLKERIKRLEAENKNLRRQHEVSYGHVLRVRDLEREIHRLKAENERLRRQSQLKNTAELAKVEDFENLLANLDVELNSTLRSQINKTPRGIVEAAIELLRETKSKGQVRNPGGFLYKAIADAWKLNDNDYQAKAEAEEFNQWWRWAYQEGLVKAATPIDGVQYVLNNNDEWLPFQEMIAIHPAH